MENKRSQKLCVATLIISVLPLVSFIGNLQASDLYDFYTEQLKRVKASSVIHYHANIHNALRYAFKTDLIPQNPADKIERPKKERFTGSFYDSEGNSGNVIYVNPSKSAVIAVTSYFKPTFFDRVDFVQKYIEPFLTT